MTLRTGRRYQSPARSVGSQCRGASMAGVYFVHLLDGVEVAHEVGRAEGRTGLDRPAVDFLDHDDDPAGALAAPGLVDHGGLERHPRQPRAVCARLAMAQVVGADEMLG